MIIADTAKAARAVNKLSNLVTVFHEARNQHQQNVLVQSVMQECGFTETDYNVTDARLVVLDDGRNHDCDARMEIVFSVECQGDGDDGLIKGNFHVTIVNGEFAGDF